MSWPETGRGVGGIGSLLTGGAGHGQLAENHQRLRRGQLVRLGVGERGVRHGG